MDRSSRFLLAGSLAVSTSLAGAVPPDQLAAHTVVADSVVTGLQLQSLSQEEMAATEGQLIGFAPVFLSLLGGVGFGVGNAIEQHNENGEVNLGEVAYVSAGGVALTGINVAAGLSGSVTAVVVAGGLSLGVTTAMAFADEPVAPAAVPQSPTPLLPPQPQAPADYHFDQSQLPQPAVIYGAEISSAAGAQTLGWGTPLPQAYPQVWGLDEVSAGAGEEHYQYF
jgi:hypothetical protein